MIPITGQGQDLSGNAEEIVVGFVVPKLIHRDIFVQYDGITIYVPMVEIFSLLEIDIEADMVVGQVRGFFLSSDNLYKIDLRSGRATVGDKSVPISPGQYFVGEKELFVEIGLFRRLFGLDIAFEFSTLSVKLSLNPEFPSYQRLARQTARKKLRTEEIALQDVVEIPRRRRAINGGVADWVIATSPLGGGGHYFNLNLGGMLAGGDFTLSGTGNSITGFQSDQLNYRWHYFHNESKYFTQVELGDVGIGGVLGRGIEGVRVTNQPQVRRKFFQTIDITGYVGESWEVELYINNELTNFAITDASGEYHFLTDIFYGSSRIMLKMFGPHGEIRTEERYSSVPQNLVPKGTFEYVAAAGKATIRDESRRYLLGSTRYGILSSLSVGASAELPVESDSLESNAFAGDFIFQPRGNMILTGGLAPGHKFMGTFNFSEPSIISLNGTFTKYFENPIRNPLNQSLGLRISLSSPVRVAGHRLGLRYFASYSKFPYFETIDMNYGFSTRLSRLHLTYMGNQKITRRGTNSERLLTSRAFLTPRLSRWFRPQFRISYDHARGAVSQAGVYIARRAFRTGQLTVSFQRDLLTKTNSVMATFNLFTDFANFSSRIVTNSGQTAISQTQRGSVRFDQQDRSFRFLRRDGVGTGTAVIWPFLDNNYNGVRDEGEPLLTELKAKLKGGRGSRRGAGDVYYYDGLIPYDEYMVQIDRYSLDNPQLLPAHENYRVMVHPNTVTGINVPIVTAGEVSGLVERQVPGALVGIGGIRMIIINEQTGHQIEVVSFNNGDYFYLGLVPGMYRISIDPQLLSKYGYDAVPTFRTFQINTVAGGDIIEDINFVLKPKE